MTLLTVLLSVLIVGALFAAMAIGVLFGRAPLQGSCGGLGAAGVEGECQFCGGRRERCPERPRRRAAEHDSAG